MSTPKRLGFPGVEAPDLKARPTGTGEFLDTEVVDAYRVDRSRDGTATPTVVDVAEGQPVELEFENGIVRWVSMETLEEEAEQQAARGGGSGPVVDDGVLWLPPDLPVGNVSRGGRDWAVRALRTFRVEIAAKAAKGAAVKLCESLEKKLVPTPGLHRLGDDLSPLGIVEAQDLVTDDDPLLVFLHGTASNTQGAFGDLGDPNQERAWTQLCKRYGPGGILGLEHFTLSESPIENAVSLIEALPSGANLHLVSHSRGGLVGDLVCLAGRHGANPGFDLEEMALLRRLSSQGSFSQAQLKAVNALNRVLRKKSITVERFVRVAATAGGTKLAGERLEDLATLLGHLLRVAAKLSGNPALPRVLEFVTAFAHGMIKTRASWDDLPGLAAQMPDSPLVRILNSGRVEVAGQLAAIAGDAEPRGLSLRSLFVFAGDRFFEEDNDFVVQTSSMVRGADRGTRGAVRTWEGKGLHHCNYFSTQETVGALIAGLQDEELSSDWTPITPPRAEWRAGEGRQRGGSEPRPLVIVVPGIMGSHLAVKRDRIWLSYRDLVFGEFSKLHIDAADVDAVGLIGKAYDDVSRFLLRAQDVSRFPFDWRISLEQEARRFTEKLEQDMAENELPVRILAHSMGGLLCRVAFAQNPSLWERFVAQDGRLVMLGTPNAGSYTIAQVLVDQEDVIRKLALIDLFNGRQDLLRIVARFPGLLQMLPRGPGTDLFSASFWEALHRDDPGDPWTPPTQADLDVARRLSSLLDTVPSDPERMLYVAGRAPLTPTAFAPRAPGEPIRFLGTQRGDGRVPWDTGIPPWLHNVWYTDAAHGDLAAHEPAFEALEQILLSGDTDLLAKTPPVSRDAGPGVELIPRPVLTHPSEEEFVAAALGGTLGPVRPARPSVTVRVKHADLGFSRHPICVGHYEGDQIVHAEHALDLRLNGELRRRHDRGGYPGPIESVDVVFNPPGRHPSGGVVVGLGRPGQLSSGALESTFLAALLRLETELRARAREGCGPDVYELGLSTLLVGTGEGGLRTRPAVQAILSAVRRANERLAAASYAAGHEIDESAIPRFSSVEFVELYEDRALRAVEAIAAVCGTERFSEFVAIDRLDRSRGGRRRAYEEEDTSWWWRINILGAPEGRKGDEAPVPALRFSFATDVARGARHSVASDPTTLDRVLAQATRSTARNDRLGQTLFELLVPNAVKDLAPDARPILLMLDEEAARYPWELLADPLAGTSDPISVRAGMVRQLYTPVSSYAGAPAPRGRVLVVANPRPTHLPNLPQASAEGAAVQEILDGDETGFDVRMLLEPSSDEVLTKLYSATDEGDFGHQILHIAAHGEFRIDDPSRSGVVIGKDTFLTTGTLRQLRRIPELVFLSCCHLGRQGPPVSREAEGAWHPLRWAANMGTELIRMGVGAVVAAGWAVDDDAAKTFAESFYRGLMRNQNFGDAVRHAREVTRRSHRNSNTWAAFQAYGKPDFRLRGQRGSRKSSAFAYRDPVQAVNDLNNLRAEGKTLFYRGRDRLGKRLHMIRKRVTEQGWSDTPRVAEALGRAHGELGEFDRAIEDLTRSTRADRADTSLRSQEELENYRARHAFMRWYESEDKRKVRRSLAKEVKTAQQRLTLLIRQFGPNMERLCLRGSAIKRLAALSTPRETDDLLKKAFDDYGEARKLAVEATGQEDFYPLTNWLALYAVRYLRGEFPDTDKFEGALDLARGLLDDDVEDHPFFGVSAGQELRSIARLVLRSDEDPGGDTIAGYRQAFERGGTLRELLSVRDQVRLLYELLDAAPKTPSAVYKKRKALREQAKGAVGQVRKALDDLIEEVEGE